MEGKSPDTVEKIIGKKRKRSPSLSDESDQPALKYLELAESFTLDQFSDEVLFEIFKHLDSITLLALEETSSRFHCLIQDHRLWNNIDLLAKEKPVSELEHALKKAHQRTKSIKINGRLAAISRVASREERECILKHIVPKCANLVDLELQNVFVDFSTIRIQDFPSNLKRLIFRSVSVRWPDNAPTVFQKMDKKLLYLEELCVESCTWFHPYDIMLFSKCPSLRRLSMRGCQNLSDFVPYGSMASRFGFKALEHLDVRETPITDSDLQCFNAILTLKELFLECPSYLRANNPDPDCASSSAPVTFVIPSAECLSPMVSPIRSVGSGSSSSTESDDESDVVGFRRRIDGAPGTSRLNRRHVMMRIDLQNQTRTVCEIPDADFRRIPNPENPRGHFGSLLRHPHFWDMIDRQTNPEASPYAAPKPQLCPITNRGVSCFGRPARIIDQNVIWIRIGHRPTNNTFEKLSLRYYERVTDDSLKHLVQCSPNLVYLDVSGTGVTQDGVEEFKVKKPQCKVVCEHLPN